MKNKYLLIILFAYFVSFELISQRKDLNLIQTSLFDNIPVRNIGPAKVSGRITKVIKENTNKKNVPTAAFNKSLNALPPKDVDLIRINQKTKKL